MRDRDEVGGWLFVRGPELPDLWRERAVPVFLVPLLPDESNQILTGGRIDGGVAPPAANENFLSLVARGSTIRQMADELGVSTRTVQQRLQELRSRLGVASKAELAALLARKGF